MSICDKSIELLASYGFYLSNNSTDDPGNGTWDPVFSHWCHFGTPTHGSHYLVGILLMVICGMSILGNLLVVVVFTRYRRLKSPANTLIVNLALSDMLNGLLHPMAVYSSFNEAWMFGRTGCEVYAALCGLFGLVSIISLTAIAIERCLVISVKPWYGGILFTNAKAKVAIVFIWAYCLGLMTPPLFGWGAFVPEGFLTSCSFDYLSRTRTNRSYFLYIFFFGFFLPIFIITVCYSFIMKTIFQNEKDMKRNNVKKVYLKPKKRNDYKAAEMIMFVIAMFLLSWTPYSLIACVGQFGDTSLLTPWVSVLPSLFAKMSTIYNPAIYGLSHRHFRATLRRMFHKGRPNSSTDRCGTNFSRNSSMNNSRQRGCPCLPYAATDEIEESSSFMGKKVYLGIPVCNHESNKVIYVKKTQSIHGSCNHVSKICDQDSGYPAIRANEVSRSRMFDYETMNYQRRGRPAIFAMQQDANSGSLIRSLMFRSECSIDQKYQTLLEKDQILKLPTGMCFNKFSFRKFYSGAACTSTIDPLIVNSSVLRLIDTSSSVLPRSEFVQSQLVLERNRKQRSIRELKKRSIKECDHCSKKFGRIAKDHLSQ